ncbi:MAG: HD domain-containing protein [Pseudomonadota bacterium]
MKTSADTQKQATFMASIRRVFEDFGADSYLGEQVTMSEHMLQAARLAEEGDNSVSLIVAALLHDIGHYINEFPADAHAAGENNHHDSAGAKVLRGLFSVEVINCVRYHVDAKRYLCTTEAGYFDRLSPASVHTLELQGGPMNDTELAEFEQLSFLESIIKVRRWDEAAKVPGLKTPNLDHYIPYIEQAMGSY